MDMKPTVVSLSAQDMMTLEMICLDRDKDEALAFALELQSRIDHTVKGMKSHLNP